MQTEFRYVNPPKGYEAEECFLEIAFQLKRVADALQHVAKKIK